MKVVNDRGLLASELWLDQEDAEAQIEDRRQKGRLTANEAEALVEFRRKGFLVFDIDVDHLADSLGEDVNRLWKEKPADLAYASDGPLTSMADASESRDRRGGYRIADLHSHSEAARNLYLHPEIHHWIHLIFDREPVAFQSLYFQFGSRQSLHRDPVYVVTTPPSHLLAVWVALEDITPDCGPLTYVPGSHLMPYYEFESGRIAIRSGEDYTEAYEFTRLKCEEAGLEPQTFTPRKGQVLLWHGSLVHGGSPVEEPGATRRSFVVHFSTKGDYQVRGSTFRKVKGDEWIELSRTTRETMEEGGCLGFRNPVEGYEADGMTLDWLKSRGKRLFRSLLGRT